MGEKVGFTNCVFESCVFFWKHYFYSVFSKTAFKKQKWYVEKKQKIYENSGLFFEHGKMVFFGFVFFWSFHVIVVCFWCVWHSSRSVKNACFPSFGGFFVGWFILVYFGFGRFRCFYVSCVCFCFLCCFCFCFVCFVFVLLLDCFLVLVFLFCFCFVFFISFVLVFFLFFFCFVFLEGLRVRWGGPKGHLTWP